MPVFLLKGTGEDPDKWVDVKSTCHCCHKEVLHNRQTRQSQGKEPVSYVENIRSYYDLLVWDDTNQDIPVAKGHTALPSISPVTHFDLI